MIRLKVVSTALGIHPVVLRVLAPLGIVFPPGAVAADKVWICGTGSSSGCDPLEGGGGSATGAGFDVPPIAEVASVDGTKVGTGIFAPSRVLAERFTTYGRLVPSKLTAPAFVLPANHREPSLGSAVLPIAFAAEIPKGCGLLGVFNAVAAVLEKATRRGNRCNAGTGGWTVDPALKGVVGVVTGDAYVWPAAIAAAAVNLASGSTYQSASVQAATGIFVQTSIT